jgi:hypothetical protein
MIPFVGIAQECQLKKEKDPFSQQPRISTGFMRFQPGKLNAALNIVAEGKEIKLLFSLGKGTCVNDDTQVIFNFDSSRTKVTQKNISAMNCDGVFSVIFRNGTTTPYQLQKLSTLKTNTIVFQFDTNQKVEVVLTEEQKQLLRQKAACISAEAKLLINPS